MRKARAARLAAILVTALVLLVSCSTTSGAEFTDEQYKTVAQSVLSETLSQTTTNLFLQINDYSLKMVHNDYRALLEYRDTIPGLDRILRQWDQYVSESLIQFFDTFKDYVQTLADGVQITDARALLTGQSNSITIYVKSLVYNQFYSSIRPSLEGMDTSLWDAALMQYRAWQSTQSKLGNDDYPTLPSDRDALDVLADHLTMVFFQSMSTAETLVRTTPDPNMDTTMAQILGID